MGNEGYDVDLVGRALRAMNVPVTVNVLIDRIRSTPDKTLGPGRLTVLFETTDGPREIAFNTESLTEEVVINRVLAVGSLVGCVFRPSISA